MTRHYYAMLTPRGADTYSDGDQLYRFDSAKARDEWVSTAFRAADGNVNKSKRDIVTRDRARYWFPKAFAPGVQVFPPAWISNDYWDDQDEYGAYWWTGSPTGGEYAHL